jgi:hypothetical protein
MIPFFRRIRKKLSDENKPLKYLRYAIGEILLIVIGILIALSINNWNTNKKNKEYERFYIQGIINDIELDIVKLNKAITYDSLKVNSGNYLLNHFKNPTLKKDSILLNHFANSIPISGFNQTDNVFEDLKSSGRLNFLSNDSLRKKIQDYYIDGEYLIQAMGANNSMSKEIYDNRILSDEFDINSVLFAINEFFDLETEIMVEVNSFDSQFFYKPLNDPAIKEFINRISMNILLSQLNENRLRIGREKANNLLNELNYYLK